MAPLRVLPPWCRRTGQRPEDGRQHGTRSDTAEAQMNRNKDGITTQLGAAERRGALTKVEAVGGHDLMAIQLLQRQNVCPKGLESR